MIDGLVYLGRSIYMEMTAGALLADMDRLGVEKAVVVAPPPGPFYSEANDYVRGAASAHPGRLVPLYRVNPHLEDEAEKARRALEEQGFKGLYLDPTNDGYGVGSEVMNPFAELARDLGAPVYIHSGDSIFCPPETVADYAGAFGEVNFVTDFSRRAPRAAKGCPNLYILSRPFPTLGFQRDRLKADYIDTLVFNSEAPLGSLDLELRRVDLSRLEENVREKVMGGTLGHIMQVD